ncbi:hypothetical protein EVAR_97336_1 [Eumeta japonica]|uniref:Uncharacterized protein n=1 Tax=Eumeta variegata TaxID=151549 RepID=A0A4C1X7V3_EUMVA|nr:hypothetical protein EVAR_97336_1 [Eumeta japonica]
MPKRSLKESLIRHVTRCRHPRVSSGRVRHLLSPRPFSVAHPLRINRTRRRTISATNRSDVCHQGYAVPEEANKFLKDENTTTYSREVSPSPSVSSGKRSSSALSSDESSTLSDDTVKGSDDDECEEAFTKVCSKSNKRKRKAARRHSDEQTLQSNTIQMELDTIQSTSTTVEESSKSPIIVKNQPNRVAGVAPTAPPKVKPPPPVFLRDKTKWNMVSSECSKLHINYSKA